MLDDFLLLCYNNKVDTAAKRGFCAKTTVKNKAKKKKRRFSLICILIKFLVYFIYTD